MLSRTLTASLCLTFILSASSIAQNSEKPTPFWLISNGFHTSFALPRRTVPFASEIAEDPRADFILIGWGAGDFYRGKTNPCTLLAAVCGLSPSLLHVVPVHGPLTHRFGHSDLVHLDLPPSNYRALLAQLDHAFARDASGARQSAGRGYYRDSRFFLGRERFYFPQMCNTWVAQKLKRSGVPIFVPTAITAPGLIRQAAKAGILVQRRSKPVDAF